MKLAPLILLLLLPATMARADELVISEPGKTALGDHFYTQSYQPSLYETSGLKGENLSYDWQFSGGYRANWQNWITFIEAGAADYRLQQQNTQAKQLISGVSYRFSSFLLTSRIRQHYSKVSDSQLEFSSAYQLHPNLTMQADYGLNLQNQQAVKLGATYRF